MSMLTLVLNGLSALAATVAAVMWFKSAWGKIPPLVVTYGGIAGDDPFIVALGAAARWNRRAAACAALSALLMGAATAAPLLAR